MSAEQIAIDSAIKDFLEWDGDEQTPSENPIVRIEMNAYQDIAVFEDGTEKVICQYAD